MKKKVVLFLIIISLIILFPQTDFCEAESQNAQISKIETEIFGFNYNNEALDNRVKRLEENIRGTFRLQAISYWEIQGWTILTEVTPPDCYMSTPSVSHPTPPHLTIRWPVLSLHL